MLPLRATVLFTYGLLVVIVTVSAYPYPWGVHHSNYDASLDPIAWSRAFVKDSIRKPRQFRTQSLRHNTLDGGQDDIIKTAMKSTISPSLYGFGKRRSATINYTKPSITRYDDPSIRTRNMMQKKFYRRRQRLEARDRYGFVKNSYWLNG